MTLKLLRSKLDEVAEFLEGRDLEDADRAKAEIEARFPFASPGIQELRALFAAGVKEGWLCDREGGGAKFSRVAKPTDQMNQFSFDAVQLSGPGVWHRHLTGEVDLCFAVSGKPKFDGHGEGWVVFPPGSEHVPTVTGGMMNILYLIPGGQLEWKRG